MITIYRNLALVIQFVSSVVLAGVDVFSSGIRSIHLKQGIM